MSKKIKDMVITLLECALHAAKQGDIQDIIPILRTVAAVFNCDVVTNASWKGVKK